MGIFHLGLKIKAHHQHVASLRRNRKSFKSILDFFVFFCYYITTVYENAKVAHLVERRLAKAKVAGSSPVFRSKNFA